MIVETADRLKGFEEYYFSRKLEEIRRLEDKGHDVINLGIGSPDLPPPDVVLQTLIKSSKNQDSHGYQSYRGIPELRSSIANFYQKSFQQAVDPETEILPLMGSKEGIMHISMAFLDKGDQVLIPSLGYPTYTSVTRILEAEPVSFPLMPEKSWQPDWEFLEKLDTSKVKLMWLNYPHMPTGAKANDEWLDWLVAYARERSILLCHDNPYSFILNPQPVSIFSKDRNKEVSLELNSLSKSFNMAGWRVGWVIGNEMHLKAVLKVKSNMDSGMFQPIQMAAATALKLGKDWFEGLNETYSQRRNVAYEILDELACSYAKDQTGMFIWAKTPSGISGEQLSDQVLRDQKVFLTPGFIFGKEGHSYIRISLCTKSSRLKEALQRIRS